MHNDANREVGCWFPPGYDLGVRGVAAVVRFFQGNESGERGDCDGELGWGGFPSSDSGAFERRKTSWVRKERISSYNINFNEFIGLT